MHFFYNLYIVLISLQTGCLLSGNKHVKKNKMTNFNYEQFN